MIRDYHLARKEAQRIRDTAFNPSMILLPSLEERLGKELPAAVSVGRMEIPLHMVKGTVHASRSNAFTSGFYPLLGETTEFARKWADLYDEMVSEGQKEPIKVYEYLFDFYVEEGNKRVSVMKYLDNAGIEAEVWRLPLKEGEAEEALYEEFLEFFACVPSYALRFHERNSYREFAKMVSLTWGKRCSVEEQRRIEAGYYRFRDAFLSFDDGRLMPYCADCFLIYCRLYSFESLLNLQKGLLENRIRNLWEEFTQQFLKRKEDPRQERKEDSQKEKSGIFPVHRDLKYDEEHPLRAAFFYSAPLSASAWTIEHEKGRQYAQKRLEGLVQTEVHENCLSEEALIKEMTSAVLKGADALFCVHAKDLSAALKVALSYPDVRLYNCSIYQQHDRISTYYAKLYEAKFLLGMLAASLSTNHKIGYVADFPFYGSVANINAFALGAAFADPFAKVYVRFSTVEKYDWREEMKRNDVRVISGHDLVKPEWGEAEKGLFVVKEDGSHHSVAEICVHWGKYYEDLFTEILKEEKGKPEQPESTWYGLSTGILSIETAEDLPPQVKRNLSRMEEMILSGALHPFAGPLYDQSGELRCARGFVLSAEEIIGMSWLNENIDGELPALGEYLPDVRESIEVSGIEEVRNS